MQGLLILRGEPSRDPSPTTAVPVAAAGADPSGWFLVELRGREPTLEWCEVAGGVRVLGGAKPTVRRCVVRDSAGSGVLVSGNARATLLHNTVRNNRLQGVGVKGGASVEMHHNTVGANLQCGVLLTETSRGALTHNLVHGNRLNGVAIQGDAEVSLGHNELGPDNRCGLSICDTARARLSGGAVGANRLHGVRALGSARLQITDAELRDNHRCGLWLAGTARVSFDACALRGSWQHGCAVQEEATLEARGVTIEDNARSGVVLFDAAKASVGADDAGAPSTIRRNRLQGVAALGTAALELTRTTVEGNSQCGIVLLEKAVGTIAHATVQGNRWEGVALLESRASLRHCVIADNRRRGVLVCRGARATVEDNELRGNPTAIDVYSLRGVRTARNHTGADHGAAPALVRRRGRRLLLVLLAMMALQIFQCTILDIYLVRLYKDTQMSLLCLLDIVAVLWPCAAFVANLLYGGGYGQLQDKSLTNQTRLHGSLLLGGGATIYLASVGIKALLLFPSMHKLSVDDLLGPNYCEAALLLTVAILFMYGYSLKPMGDLTMAGQADSQVRNRALLDVVDALDLFRLWRVLEVFDAPADGAEADLVAVSRSDCDVSARLGWATSRLGGLPSGNPWLGGVTAALVLIALLTAGFAWCAFPMCGRLRLHHRLAEPMTDLLLERKRSYWMFSLWFVDLPFFTIRCVYFFGYGVPVSTFLARNVVDIGSTLFDLRILLDPAEYDWMRFVTPGSGTGGGLSASGDGGGGSGRGGGGDDGVAAEGFAIGDASVGGGGGGNGVDEVPRPPMRPRSGSVVSEMNLDLGSEPSALSRRASHSTSLANGASNGGRDVLRDVLAEADAAPTPRLRLESDPPMPTPEEDGPLRDTPPLEFV